MSGSMDYSLPVDLQGVTAKVGGDSPGGVVVAIPAGCAALWHANTPAVDGADIVARAAEAARRTHRDQAVLLSDGTVKVIPGSVPGMTTS